MILDRAIGHRFRRTCRKDSNVDTNEREKQREGERTRREGGRKKQRERGRVKRDRNVSVSWSSMSLALISRSDVISD